MKKTKITPQKPKAFDAKKKENNKNIFKDKDIAKDKNKKVYGKKPDQKNKIKKTESSPIDETVLFEKSLEKLEKEKIYLLELKLALLKKDRHVYAVIHKIPDVSHKDCIEATKIIQSVINNEGFNEDDYGVTVSSAGFSWVFKSDKEYSVFENNNIKIKYFSSENIVKNNTEEKTPITEKGILKENKTDFIVFERENGKKIEIKKANIIKARLNN